MDRRERPAVCVGRGTAVLGCRMPELSGGASACGSGMLQRDEGARQAVQREIVARLPLPGDEHRPEPVTTAPGAIDDPALRTLMHAPHERRIALLPDVRRDPTGPDDLLAVARPSVKRWRLVPRFARCRMDGHGTEDEAGCITPQRP